MKKNSQSTTCTYHVMPSTISDSDITALFNGLTSIIKHKVEVETKAEILNANLSLTKVLNELKEKTAECNRLKNEIIFLQNEIKILKATKQQNADEIF